MMTDTHFNCDVKWKRGKKCKRAVFEFLHAFVYNILMFESVLSRWACFPVDVVVAVFRFWFYYNIFFFGLNHCRWTKLLIHISIFFSDINFNFQDQYQLRPLCVFSSLFYIEWRRGILIWIVWVRATFCHFCTNGIAMYDSWFLQLFTDVGTFGILDFLIICLFAIMQLVDDDSTFVIPLLFCVSIRSSIIIIINISLA